MQRRSFLQALSGLPFGLSVLGKPQPPQITRAENKADQEQLNKKFTRLLLQECEKEKEKMRQEQHERSTKMFGDKFYFSSPLRCPVCDKHMELSKWWSQENHWVLYCSPLDCTQCGLVISGQIKRVLWLFMSYRQTTHITI